MTGPSTPGRAEHTLTASDIMTLRYWRKTAGGFIRDGEPDRGYPFIVFSPASGTYYLHSQGVTCAASEDGAVILACLRSERIEPGFMQRVLSASTHAEEALLSPEHRYNAQVRLAEANARAKARQAELTEEQSRRAKHFRPPATETLTLDDLI